MNNEILIKINELPDVENCNSILINFSSDLKNIWKKVNYLVKRKKLKKLKKFLNENEINIEVYSLTISNGDSVYQIND